MIDSIDFLAYQRVRQSGTTNMFDIPVVRELSGLPLDKVLDIMEHYLTYRKYFDEDVFKELVKQLPEGGRSNMKARKGMTKNQKLKKLGTSKLKKLAKSTKK